MFAFQHSLATHCTFFGHWITYSWFVSGVLVRFAELLQYISRDPLQRARNPLFHQKASQVATELAFDDHAVTRQFLICNERKQVQTKIDQKNKKK